MRRKFVAGNWKMNCSLSEAQQLAQDICTSLEKEEISVDVAICPTFLCLSSICSLVKDFQKQGGSDIGVGAQNLHWENKGAFTGEVSAPMLHDMGCSYAIIGHSERRTLFGETNEAVSKKALAALQSGLLPIVCIGETLEERENEKTEEVLRLQLEGSLAGLSPAQVEACTIAYEPVWAIGTGKTASPEMAQTVHAFIRNYLTQKYTSAIAQSIRIQYGGSVKPDNIRELINQPDIDGALVGGASLKADSFSEIIKLCSL